MSHQTLDEKILALREALSQGKANTPARIKAEDFLPQHHVDHDQRHQKRLLTFKHLAQIRALEAEKTEKELRKQRFIKGLLGA